MASVSIQLNESKTHFCPRETAIGRVSWSCETTPKSAAICLRWRARGGGVEDSDIVQTIPLPNPQAIESRPFSIVLPAAPYSFSGSLVSLDWWLEIVVQPGEERERVGIILAPEGVAVSLPKVLSS